MSDDLLTSLVTTLQHHSLLALLFVFLVAFSESLIIVGLIVPGAVLMILFGTLIALDALSFWSTMLVAMAGAVAGDSLSYYLGYRYQERLLSIWPLSKQPELIEKAHGFLHRHGKKSLFLARFIGLLRPVIPAIAGMAAMPRQTFILANVSSALLWAPLYLLPGILFGMSFELASEFAGKFIFIVLLAIVIIMICLWLLQRLYLYARPLNDKMINALLNWGKKHRLAGEMPVSVFDSEHPEWRGLSMIALLIFTITLAITLVHKHLLLSYNIVPYDSDSFNQFIYFSLQDMQSPPLDVVMLWLLAFSSSESIALLALLMGGLFIAHKNFLTLWHFLAAILLPLLLAPLLNNPLAQQLQQGIDIGFHTLPIVVVISMLGFLVIIFNAGLSYSKQKIIFYISSTLILFLILAQLYFAHQVSSQVFYSLLIAFSWFNLLGIAYRRHSHKFTSAKLKKEMLFALLLVSIVPSWQVLQQDAVHRTEENHMLISQQGWLEDGWQLLPVHREGLYQHKTFFNLQWLGNSHEISSKLKQAGFVKRRNSLKTFTHWFFDQPELAQLPLAPHIHQGQYEAMRFARYNRDKTELLVIRLWPSRYKIRQDGPARDLWFGSITRVAMKKRLGINYLYTLDKPVNEFTLTIPGITVKKKSLNGQKVIFLVY